MIAAIWRTSSLTEPETQGLFIREPERTLRNAEDSFERSVVGRDSTLHDLKSDGPRLPRQEEIRGLQLKAQHEGDKDVGRVIGRLDIQRSPVAALSHDCREDRHHDAPGKAPALPTDDGVAVR